MTDTIERGMFYGAKPPIFKKAEVLRKNMTECEKILWKRINNKRIMWYRFKPQHPIDIFIADFYCHKLRLVVEIDGEIHNESDRQLYDIGRTAEIERFDIKVIRYTNEDVKNRLSDVVKDIVNKCLDRAKEMKGKSF
ncbi:MAG TPA: endonuclease domain-containing protein [Prolixibacteraceae bacterium]|nr:endonuclease domain-containing protein [Prolixibacteraceae bacterium]